MVGEIIDHRVPSGYKTPEMLAPFSWFLILGLGYFIINKDISLGKFSNILLNTVWVERKGVILWSENFSKIKQC